MNFEITQNNQRNRRQPVVPLVTRQILSSQQQEFRLFGTPIQIAVLVGIVRDVTVQEKQIICFIEDSTGKIKASITLETETEITRKLASMKENAYAQVFGSLRFINGEKIFMIIKIFPVDDANVIICHLLQVICTRLEAEDDLKKQVTSAATTGAALANSLATTNEVTTVNVPLHLTSLQEAVFSIIKAEDSCYGITKQNILRQFPSYQGHEVSQVLEYFISEGLIYPTTDQNHLKATVDI